MKHILLAVSLLFSGVSSQAAPFKVNDYVYDSVFRTLLYIDSIDNGFYYVRYLRGNETSYPRYASDLSPVVDSYGRFHRGMDVSYLNMSTRQWQHDTIKYVFANGIAWFNSPIGQYGVGVTHLGVETDSVAGSSLKIGDIACPLQRTTHHRAAGSRGVVSKFYDNGSALMKFKDFLIVNAWEVVPLSNLTTHCKK